MLKFSEFFMLMFFVHIGVDIGPIAARLIHYPDPGPITWLGAVFGLFIGVLLMPVTNETAYKKLYKGGGK